MFRTPWEQAIWLYGASEQNVGVEWIDGWMEWTYMQKAGDT